MGTTVGTFIQKNILAAQLSMKLLFHRRALFSPTTLFSIAGLVFGVASLVVAMSIMSGFEVTLSKALSDVTGHVRVYNRSTHLRDYKEVYSQLRQQESRIVSGAPFLVVEGVLSHHGRIGGIVFHGLGPSTGVDVLSIHSRLIEVEKWTEVGQLGVNEVYIGKGVAEQWGLRLNDRFKVVVPVPDDKSGGFSRHVSELQVKGILDLGRYDWNQRTLMGNLETAQLMSQIDSRQFFGLTLRLQEGRLAKEVSESLTERFKTYFDFQSWSDLNENLLRAVAFDRAVVFLVVMLIVVVAAFNISSSLIVSVMSRYSDISLLRTIGFDQGSIQRIFVWQGFFVAVVGTLVGLVVGMGLGLIFEILQTKLNLLNGSVYRLDGIKVAWQMKDFLLVVISTLVVCVLASWFPARRGSKLSIVEGLRYG